MCKLAIPLLIAFAGSVGCSKDSSQGDTPAPSATPSAEAPAASASAPAPADSSSATAAADDGNTGADNYDDQDPSAVSDFHSALDSKGTWVDDGKYGTVWVPAKSAVGDNFVPYQSGGHWAYGDDYTWVSDYDWGWAPFHYGRWAWIDGQGWSWIPGRTYSPAWVSWRAGAPGFGFIGWSPLAPTWGWRAGAVFSFGFPVVARWSYCGTGDLFLAHGLSGRILVGGRIAEAERGTRPWEGEGGRRGGPPPARVGIPADHVAHPPANDPGLQHAQSFGKPSTSGSVGGHPPAKGSHGTEHGGEHGSDHGSDHGNDPSKNPPSSIQDNNKGKGGKSEPDPKPPSNNKPPGNKHH
jgi:hypothetical protein